MTLEQRIANAEKWVSDEEDALKEMERRHARERAEQHALRDRARDALSFARGSRHALESQS